MSIEVRVLTTADELAALPEFEKFIWGEEDEMVSVNMLVATISEGGVALGAYDHDAGGELVGMAYGFATKDPEALHSHYLAVHPRLRGSGLGERIKREQADWCRANGIRLMRWTYDPLQLTNAHLNLNKLACVGISYHVNHYGALGGINGGMPSDRLTVQWWLDGTPPVRATEPVETLVVAVPAVSPEQIAAAAPEAFAARYAVRDAMVPAFADGWQVVGVDLAARTYTMARARP